MDTYYIHILPIILQDELHIHCLLYTQRALESVRLSSNSKKSFISHNLTCTGCTKLVSRYLVHLQSWYGQSGTVNKASCRCPYESSQTLAGGDFFCQTDMAITLTLSLFCVCFGGFQERFPFSCILQTAIPATTMNVLRGRG